jgi:signal transduction histidine kinase
LVRYKFSIIIIVLILFLCGSENVVGQVSQDWLLHDYGKTTSVLTTKVPLEFFTFARYGSLNAEMGVSSQYSDTNGFDGLSQKRLWIGIAVGLFLLVLTLSVLLQQYLKNQKLKFRQQEQEHNQRIFEAMLGQKEKLLEGKQMAQKRISEELHDGVLGQLLGIRLILSSLNDKSGEAVVREREKVLRKMQEVEEELRLMSHELSHASYQKVYNFIFSIEELLEVSLATEDMAYRFDYTEGMDWDSLHGELKINLYRIIQECLHNSIKHAQADFVDVILKTEGNVLQLVIADNGQGFSFDKQPNGIGFRNIGSRVKKMGGQWQLESKLGKGTYISVELELTENRLGTSRSVPLEINN